MEKENLSGVTLKEFYKERNLTHAPDEDKVAALKPLFKDTYIVGGDEIPPSTSTETQRKAYETLYRFTFLAKTVNVQELFPPNNNSNNHTNKSF